MNNKSTRQIIVDAEEPIVIENYNKKDTKWIINNEKELEDKFIELLKFYGYELLSSNVDLKENLRIQLEKFNDIKFTNNEWEYVLKNYIDPINDKDDKVDKIKRIQNWKSGFNIKLDNGESKNIYLIDGNNILKNNFQVIRQYCVKGTNNWIYDVVILINGIPLVQIELKNLNVALQNAYEQIVKYDNLSHAYSKNRLFHYLQLYVISNYRETLYFANWIGKTPISYKFVNKWSDANNIHIDNLEHFTETFLKPFKLLKIITNYCILDTTNKLKVMRPYQICAAERIINFLKITNNSNVEFSSKNTNRYIWHTTGSGKTLTSFKVAKLAKELDFINKVIFVVDRQDLDHQTVKEYNSFEDNSTQSTLSSKYLEKALKNENYDEKIIVTTIQKLNKVIQRNDSLEIYKKHNLIIFDECHRSQFGQMHELIANKFKKTNFIGFTGTPIFEENKTSSNNIDKMLNNHNVHLKNAKTTDELFGKCLHKYQIINAMEDHNVLKFKYLPVNVNPQNNNENIQKIINTQQRVDLIIDHIVKNFSAYTNRQEFNNNKFNAMFAVSSIDDLKMFYESFKNNKNHNLKVMAIFSANSNKQIEITGELQDENNESFEGLVEYDIQFLNRVMDDYEKMFNEQIDKSSNGYKDFFKKISSKVKNKEIDLLIVVNMFLTGFDAPELNTLFLDKYLKMHGLVQAFSRTNRIFDSNKKAGNIVTFRDLKEKLDEAMLIFGTGSENQSPIISKKYGEYLGDYLEVIKKIKEIRDIGFDNIDDETKKKFIQYTNEYLDLNNQMNLYEEYNKDRISDQEFQDIKIDYLNCKEYFSKKDSVQKTQTSEEIIYSLEILNYIDINETYIIELIKKQKTENINLDKAKKIISKYISSSISLRPKEELLLNYFDKHWNDPSVEYNDLIKEEESKSLVKIVDKYELDYDKTFNFMQSCFIRKEFNENIQDIGNKYKLNLLDNDNEIKRKKEMKEQIKNELKSHFYKFNDYGLY